LYEAYSFKSCKEIFIVRPHKYKVKSQFYHDAIATRFTAMVLMQQQNKI